MPKHKRGFIPNKYGVVIQREVASSGGDSGGGDAVATRNILNGVLNCAWDKTSAAPKLLEVYENSFVKFNIDGDNPLVMAFANGWDDKDRPAQVVKRLAVAPSNIDLSAKANCHVQIVAKVVNDELVITTHDIYDPAVGYGSNIVPDFSSGATPTSLYGSIKDGWTVQLTKGTPWNDTGAYNPSEAFDRNISHYLGVCSSQSLKLQITAPCSFYPSLFRFYGLRYSPCTVSGWNETTGSWDLLCSPAACIGAWGEQAAVSTRAYQIYELFASNSSTNNARVYEMEIYERPTAKFYRGLNKVKDRSDVEQLWINLGYATVDASGNITALNHYTDLRNNYPGGMRVEA